MNNSIDLKKAEAFLTSKRFGVPNELSELTRFLVTDCASYFLIHGENTEYQLEYLEEYKLVKDIH